MGKKASDVLAKGQKMESVEKTIKQNNMFAKGEKIAVACSGGLDSMCLLHYLFSNRKKYGIDVIAVNVDHSIRSNSGDDSKFVEDFCKQNGIVCHKFKVDVLSLAETQKLGIEESARIARYKIFDSLVQKHIVDKVAIAHHMQDQVETILLNIFRGAGLKGASGMSAKQDNFVRPFLNTSKTEIKCYMAENNIPHVEDETNQDAKYSRNFLRLQILPELRKHWKNVDSNILNFAKICKQDDEYIASTIDFDDIAVENKVAKIPLYHFAYPIAVQNRVLRYAFARLGLTKDVERRHLDILRSLIESGENGSKISLPNNLKASLEYDCLTISLFQEKPRIDKDFKCGKTNFLDYAIVQIKKTTNFAPLKQNCHTMDASKLPKDAKWRTRKDGDVFAKFGCGEKKLKEYFIDKKIPNRLRDNIPVLASGNQILCVLGYEISDKVKVDDKTKSAYVIEYTRR